MDKFYRIKSLALLFALIVLASSLETLTQTANKFIYNPTTIPTYPVGKLQAGTFIEIDLTLVQPFGEFDLSLVDVQLVEGPALAIISYTQSPCSSASCNQKFEINKNGDYSISLASHKMAVEEHIILRFEMTITTTSSEGVVIGVHRLSDIIRSYWCKFIFMDKERTLHIKVQGNEVQPTDQFVLYSLESDEQGLILSGAKANLKTKDTKVFHPTEFKESTAVFEFKVQAGYYLIAPISSYSENSLTMTYQTDAYVCPYNQQFQDYFKVFAGCQKKLIQNQQVMIRLNTSDNIAEECATTQ